VRLKIARQIEGSAIGENGRRPKARATQPGGASLKFPVLSLIFLMVRC